MYDWSLDAIETLGGRYRGSNARLVDCRCCPLAYPSSAGARETGTTDSNYSLRRVGGCIKLWQIPSTPRAQTPPSRCRYSSPTWHTEVSPIVVRLIFRNFNSSLACKANATPFRVACPEGFDFYFPLPPPPDIIGFLGYAEILGGRCGDLKPLRYIVVVLISTSNVRPVTPTTWRERQLLAVGASQCYR
jgi:hypothetical protein